MNNTANPATITCPLEEVCGFGGFHGKDPSQWFRLVIYSSYFSLFLTCLHLSRSFITPIFLHAGIIHILLNMLAQWSLSAQIEREMGSGGFIITYFAGGIFGYVCSGAL